MISSAVSKRGIMCYSMKKMEEFISKKACSFQKSEIKIKLLKKALPKKHGFFF